jgi:hypothetical protein
MRNVMIKRLGNRVWMMGAALVLAAPREWWDWLGG